MNKLLILSLLTVAAFLAFNTIIKNQESFLLATSEDGFPRIRPDYFEFNTCLINFKCHSILCPKDDRTCNMDIYNYGQCRISSSNCLQADQDYMDMNSDDFLTDNYYQCYKDCGPVVGQNSVAFVERLSCEGLCAGIPMPK